MLALLLAGQLASDLDPILDHADLANALVAAKVMTLGGETLYERNSTILVVPASNQKLLTCAYALARLGSSYRPKTRIWKLKDRLVVDSPGDPSMTYARLLDAKERLKLTKKLPVYVRQTYRPGVPPDWELDDLPNKYAAPITAFTVDRGSFELWASGSKAFFKPRNYGTHVQYVGGGKGAEYDPFHKVVRVKSSLPSGRVDTLALPEPDKAAASILGGSFGTAKTVPSTAPTLTITGDSIGEVVVECMTESDNNYAENLLMMAALKEGPLGADAYDTAAKRLEAFIWNKFNLPAGQLRPRDGSGLSRHNLVSATALCQVLAGMANDPIESGTWFAALPIPGKGTLENRLEGTSFRGKTGTLDSVSAISGYIKTSEGETLVVCLVFNHYKSGNSQVRALADEFLRKIEATRFGEKKIHESRSLQASVSVPLLTTADADRVYRLNRNSSSSRSRDDRRAEPRHEGSHRAERMAVRSR